MEKPMKTILSIAGSDTSAGAGLQQDLKTITALGHYALTVPTALTAQNTMGVTRVMAVPDDMMEAQLDAVMADFDIDAVKIGMLPERSSAEIVADRLSRMGVPIVCDPVMVSTSGTPLMSEDCMTFITSRLFPLTTLITPNIPEAMCLAGRDVNEKPDRDTCDSIGRQLAARFHTAILLKGGHLEGNVMCDTLYLPDGNTHSFSSPKVMTRNLHGTGCTLSSAIATFIAQGMSLEESIRQAKGVIDNGIRNAMTLRIGHGNGPLWITPM